MKSDTNTSEDDREVPTSTDVADVRELKELFANSEPIDEPDVYFEERPWIPKGQYEAAYCSHYCQNMQWGPKLTLGFKVCGGEYNGIEIPRFYNVSGIDKKGRPRFARSGAFRKEMAVIFPHLNLRQFAWKWFHDVLVTVSVIDTGETPNNVWSKIEKVIGAKRL